MKINIKNIFNLKISFKIPFQKKFLVFGDKYESSKEKDTFFFGILNYDKYFVFDKNFENVNFWIIIYSILRLKFSKKGYFNTLIKTIKPKYILTCHDNSLEFYLLKNIYPSKTFIAIQNGWRGKKFDIFDDDIIKTTSSSKFSCDYLLCFNEAFGNKYSKLIQTKILNVGSVTANSFDESNYKNYSDEITFLLQFRPKKKEIYSQTSQGDNIKWDDLFLPTGQLLKYLNEFCLKNNIKLKILGRSRWKSEWDQEKKFISKFLNCEYCYKPKISKFSSYENAFKSRLIVSISSTLAYEMIGLGKRVINIHTRKSVFPDIEDTFLWPNFSLREGPFWTEEFTREKVFELLKFAYFSDDDKWFEKVSIYTKNLMTRDKENHKLKNLLNG